MKNLKRTLKIGSVMVAATMLAGCATPQSTQNRREAHKVRDITVEESTYSPFKSDSIVTPGQSYELPDTPAKPIPSLNDFYSAELDRLLPVEKEDKSSYQVDTSLETEIASEIGKQKMGAVARSGLEGKLNVGVADFAIEGNWQYKDNNKGIKVGLEMGESCNQVVVGGALFDLTGSKIDLTVSGNFGDAEGYAVGFGRDFLNGKKQNLRVGVDYINFSAEQSVAEVNANATYTRDIGEQGGFKLTARVDAGNEGIRGYAGVSIGGGSLNNSINTYSMNSMPSKIFDKKEPTSIEVSTVSSDYSNSDPVNPVDPVIPVIPVIPVVPVDPIPSGPQGGDTDGGPVAN